MIITEHNKTTETQKRAGMFIWRMCVSSDLYMKVTTWDRAHRSYHNIKTDITRIRKLQFTDKGGAMNALLNAREQEVKDAEEAVNDIMAHSVRLNISAFHKDVGEN